MSKEKIVAWITDPHLNFLSYEDRKAFYKTLDGYHYIILSGDIADGKSVVNILEEMIESISGRILFVLGNHDYYHSSVIEMRLKIWALCEAYGHDQLCWLTHSTISHVIRHTQLVVGVDGWADASAGNINTTSMRLSDSRYIKDLVFAERLGGWTGLSHMMKDLAYKDNEMLKAQFHNAETQHPNLTDILVVTHVPPFVDSSLYQNKVSDGESAPFFVNVSLGKLLIEEATQHPHKRYTVLCGHTHHKALYSPLSNLTIKTGHAEYGKPQIEESM